MKKKHLRLLNTYIMEIYKPEKAYESLENAQLLVSTKKQRKNLCKIIKNFFGQVKKTDV